MKSRAAEEVSARKVYGELKGWRYIIAAADAALTYRAIEIAGADPALLPAFRVGDLDPSDWVDEGMWFAQASDPDAWWEHRQRWDTPMPDAGWSSTLMVCGESWDLARDRYLETAIGRSPEAEELTPGPFDD